MSTFILIVLDIILVIIPLIAIVYFKTKSSTIKNSILVVLVIVSFLSLIAFVYAFYGQLSAKKVQIQAEMNLVLAETARKEADANAAQAKKQAEIARMEAESARQIVKRSEAELAKCRSEK